MHDTGKKSKGKGDDKEPQGDTLPPTLCESCVFGRVIIKAYLRNDPNEDVFSCDDQDEAWKAKHPPKRIDVLMSYCHNEEIAGPEEPVDFRSRVVSCQGYRADLTTTDDLTERQRGRRRSRKKRRGDRRH